jgi:RNA polymerase sigma factor (sigma-70 family)
MAVQSAAPDRPDTFDSALVARCRAGEAAAWRELVQHYRRLVFSYPRRAGLDESASEDVFQEVFAILHTKLPAIERDSGLPKWIATTAHRVTLRALEKRRKARRDPIARERLSETPEEAIGRWERLNAVREALDAIGDRCRTLLEALVAASESDGERPQYALVAERLGVPVGSLGPTRARCLAKLLERLRTSGIDPADLPLEGPD